MSAADEFEAKTRRVNEMWQTDFTYFKIIGCGWYYLSTIIDDYSRSILTWDLCSQMTSKDMMPSVDKALLFTGIKKENAPNLLSDNGGCYISDEIKAFLKRKGIKPINGKPMHPHTQGKIERYHRTMKNVVKLDNYYSPENFVKSITEFVKYYNYERYHESLRNLTPADVYFGRDKQILKERSRIKEKTMMERRKNYIVRKLELDYENF